MKANEGMQKAAEAERRLNTTSGMPGTPVRGCMSGSPGVENQIACADLQYLGNLCCMPECAALHGNLIVCTVS